MSFQILSTDITSETKFQDISYLHFNKHSSVWGLERAKMARNRREHANNLGKYRRTWHWSLLCKPPKEEIICILQEPFSYPSVHTDTNICSGSTSCDIFVFCMCDGMWLCLNLTTIITLQDFKLPLTLLHSQAYNALYLYSLYWFPLLWDSFLH